MFTVSKRIEISAAHRVCTDYQSPCNQLHGHNWIITVYCRSEELNNNGMVIDFAEIKQKIHGVLDHKILNDILPCNPTAENIAQWVCGRLPNCFKVIVQESEGNIAIYEKPTCLK